MSHLSGMTVTGHLERPTRGCCGPNRPRWCGSHHCRMLGLAPTGGYRAASVTGCAVGSYPTFSPLPPGSDQEAVRFLWPDPSPCGAQALPGSLPVGARTFLGVSPATIRSAPDRNLTRVARLRCSQSATPLRRPRPTGPGPVGPPALPGAARGPRRPTGRPPRGTRRQRRRSGRGARTLGRGAGEPGGE
jgi:hypothetical protein